MKYVAAAARQETQQLQTPKCGVDALSQNVTVTDGNLRNMPRALKRRRTEDDDGSDLVQKLTPKGASSVSVKDDEIYRRRLYVASVREALRKKTEVSGRRSHRFRRIFLTLV